MLESNLPLFEVVESENVERKKNTKKIGHAIGFPEIQVVFVNRDGVNRTVYF